MFLVIDAVELIKEYGTPVIGLITEDREAADSTAEEWNNRRIPGHKSYGVYALTQLVAPPEEPQQPYPWN